ncbi:MAG: N-acetylglucosamine kinase [Armatimonadota bacterium]|nr:MAG: N-acetylglucosamine kinase [Armatimonadota bacterium]
MIPSTLLAIDAGGTKTDLLWAQPDGRVLAHVQGQGINIASKPPGAWQEVLEELFRQAGVDHETVHVVCAGAAGYTLPDRRALLEHLLQQMLPSARVLVLADYAIALEGATGGNPGVLVIAGTGSIACGRDREGKLMRAGGWGYLLGDEGSGFWIGREAVRAVLAANEGWGEQTRLYKMLSDTLGSDNCGDWLSALYRTQNPQSLLAQLAPLVTEAAVQGDAPAQGILYQAAEHLAQLVVQLAQHLQLPADFPVCIVGGVWQSQAVLQRFRQHLSEQLPDWQGEVKPPMYSPVEGALLIAQRMMWA